MEIIPPIITELGQTVTTLFIVYLIIVRILDSRKKNGDGKKDSSQDIDIAVMKVMTNHIPHIQADITQMKIDIAVIKEAVKK